MPRWESDARGRLERAALDLFETQGFERTSVAQIARAAGLTERSFYRHFSDKREVLFADDELQAHLVGRVEAADPDLAPIEVLLAALETADEVFRSREFLLRRVKVIAASPALAERDLIKLADLARAMAGALERRGVEPGAARLVVDVATAITRRATSRWLTDPDAVFPELVRQAAAELNAAVAPLASAERRGG
ncbi:TetR/AcrR family transcriptional regulator [Nonomuraea fuscirosea]|uniref:TetR/AcrR family transcriptional regulator n=1 Tax=Nonomuraea fuscirosea TaxID=1291556 RepID=UPI00340308E6